jgi:hypothetical protein
MYAKTLLLNLRSMMRRRRQMMASTTCPINSRNTFTSHQEEASLWKSMWVMKGF